VREAGIFEVPVDNGAIVVFMTGSGEEREGEYEGTGSFIVSITGAKYPVWEWPFLGLPPSTSSLIIYSIIGFLLLLTVSILYCCCCCRSKKNKEEKGGKYKVEDILTG